MVERVRKVTNLPALDYLFNEGSTPLPDLGGIQFRILNSSKGPAVRATRRSGPSVRCTSP